MTSVTAVAPERIENLDMVARSLQDHHSPATHSAIPLDPAKQPGHWLLASLGKRVLRPGGLKLTRELIGRLNPGADDDIVEFAPGLGITARMMLARHPRSYTGIEREIGVAHRLENELGCERIQFIAASAESTGLNTNSASIVMGEAMLSMQTPAQKQRISAEAFRILKQGGRYAIHELALPDEIAADTRKAIEREMSLNIHVGVRPATLTEWRQLVEQAGFRLDWQTVAPMHLLEPKRLLNDEGLPGILRILFNLLRRPIARRRVISMRRIFRKYDSQITAVAIICKKP